MPKKRITRKVTARYRGLDRTASKAVFALESKVGELTRKLRACQEKHRTSRVQEIYDALTPRNRRKLVEYAELLLGTPKK